MAYETATTGFVLGVQANEVQVREPEWLWPDWIPIGAATFIEGDPGLGKSTVLCSLVAALTKGSGFPFSQGTLCGYDEDGDERYEYQRGLAVMLSIEDDPATILVPRLWACNAQTDKVYIVSGVMPEGAAHPRDPLIPTDVESLRAYIEGINAERQSTDRHRVKMVTLDPFTAYLPGDTDLNQDVDIRQALRPLIRLAEELNFALVLGRHFNKAARGKGGIASGLGSIGMTGAARAVISVQEMKDTRLAPDEPNFNSFTLTKANYGRSGATIYYRVWVGEGRPESPESTYVEWSESIPEVRVEMEAPKKMAETPRDWLVEKFSGDQKSFRSPELLEAGVKVGWTEDQLREARKSELADRVVIEKLGNVWWWSWVG